MAVTVTLPALLALFKIDRDLHTLRVGLDNVQKDQKRQAGKIAAMMKDLETQDIALKKLQAEISTRDLELKTRQAHIEKARESLSTTKTNKEYSAILVHISGEKAEVAKLEESVLEQMQTAETAGKAIATLKEQIAGEQAALAKIEAEHSDKVAALNQEIESLTGGGWKRRKMCRWRHYNNMIG